MIPINAHLGGGSRIDRHRSFVGEAEILRSFGDDNGEGEKGGDEQGRHESR